MGSAISKYTSGLPLFPYLSPYAKEYRWSFKHFQEGVGKELIEYFKNIIRSLNNLANGIKNKKREPGKWIHQCGKKIVSQDCFLDILETNGDKRHLDQMNYGVFLKNW